MHTLTNFCGHVLYRYFFVLKRTPESDLNACIKVTFCISLLFCRLKWETHFFNFFVLLMLSHSCHFPAYIFFFPTVTQKWWIQISLFTLKIQNLSKKYIVLFAKLYPKFTCVSTYSFIQTSTIFLSILLNINFLHIWLHTPVHGYFSPNAVTVVSTSLITESR